MHIFESCLKEKDGKRSANAAELLQFFVLCQMERDPRESELPLKILQVTVRALVPVAGVNGPLRTRLILIILSLFHWNAPLVSSTMDKDRLPGARGRTSLKFFFDIITECMGDIREDGMITDDERLVVLGLTGILTLETPLRNSTIVMAGPAVFSLILDQLKVRKYPFCTTDRVS